MIPLEYLKYLYLRKVDDVRQRVAADDHYDIIMASAILRHLLFDDLPLIHRANSDLRLKLTFAIFEPRVGRAGVVASIPPISHQRDYPASFRGLELTRLSGQPFMSN